MGRRRYLLIALGLLAAAILAVVFASGTDPQSVGSGSAAGSGREAPELDAEGWINSEPLTDADLAGKVVLYDFWTYSCVNCVRTLPYLRSWHARYADDGLVVIGIHSPEFAFEKDHDNVRDAVDRLGVDYPVALDDEMVIWNAFANQYWPADYLYDKRGKEAFVHFGEGGYDETEDHIRKLLGVDADSPRAEARDATDSRAGEFGITAETYNGAERGQAAFVSPEPLQLGTGVFTAPASLGAGEHALAGTWLVDREFVESGEAGAAIRMRYIAGEVNLVMATASGDPIDVTVQVDDRAPTTVRVEAADLYNLVDDDAADVHDITVTATAPGLRAFAFTFGA